MPDRHLGMVRPNKMRAAQRSSFGEPGVHSGLGKMHDLAALSNFPLATITM
jgi:hypothetical protein